MWIGFFGNQGFLLNLLDTRPCTLRQGQIRALKQLKEDPTMKAMAADQLKKISAEEWFQAQLDYMVERDLPEQFGERWNGMMEKKPK
jgi:hypothetical protein